jgi:riboflavin synthase
LPAGWKGIKKGSSIAVNGTCLTVFQKKRNLLYFFCQQETLDLTNLGLLPLKTKVNLEPAMKAEDSFDGHWVQGHVDFTAVVKKKEIIGEGFRFWIQIPHTRGMVLKGSVAVDGISLTISRLKQNDFAVDIIPYTYQNTNISIWERGTKVNIETDLIGKYILKYFNSKGQKGDDWKKTFNRTLSNR